ncbi:MAG: LuxR family transcriptional regulator, partial [Firmicutes bacterium]|nr:LuxR family transcriptional regulator [Bacillota bacterium]
MAPRGNKEGLLRIAWGERHLPVVAHALFSGWMLSFLFEGQIIYALARLHQISPTFLVFSGIAACFGGLLLGGLLINTKRRAKRLFLHSYPLCIPLSLIFLFPPTVLWNLAMIGGSFLAGISTAAWGFYLKESPRKERFKTVADLLILSNLFMILLNVTAIHVSVRLAVIASALLLAGAFFAALQLPEADDSRSTPAVIEKIPFNLIQLLGFLYVFIFIITINSGLMYQVFGSAFAHLSWLSSWYWALPYIAALLLVRNSFPGKDRGNLLYIGISMIGLSFIGFLYLNRSVPAYLLINTLMLGACGVYDLFWWTTLGEMLDFHANPALILGTGLAANVLGVFTGGVFGQNTDPQGLPSSLLALT